MLERIIVNQIEILLDSQMQDDFEKDLTARQRKIPAERARRFSFREKRVSALTMLLNSFGAISECRPG